MNWNWSGCKKILCIRADNMGDLIMSSPAIRALKESFSAEITLLTSKMATGVAKFLPEIDEVITYDLPWIKTQHEFAEASFLEIVDVLRSRNFDAAVIFTVCSQNPLPAAMLAYLAGIPLRLAYCRENPYALLSHWVPDEEPYTKIQHQVKRDLQLVSKIGATSQNDKLKLDLPCLTWETAQEKMKVAGIDGTKPYLVFHPGVSEEKRQYPKEQWVELGQKLLEQYQLPIVITGASSEKPLADLIKSKIGAGSYSMAGVFSLEEFMNVISNAMLVISVNTGTIHVAAALGTPMIVLYALTNPQHLPWKAKGEVFMFDVPKDLRSKNEVIVHMHEHLMPLNVPTFAPDDVVKSVRRFLEDGFEEFPETLPLRNHQVLQ